MNQEELQDRILMLNHLEQQEVKPAARMILPLA